MTVVVEHNGRLCGFDSALAECESRDEVLDLIERYERVTGIGVRRRSRLGRHTRVRLIGPFRVAHDSIRGRFDAWYMALATSTGTEPLRRRPLAWVARAPWRCWTAGHLRVDLFGRPATTCIRCRKEL